MGVASQLTNSDQRENNYSGQNFVLDNGIFLKIMGLYDDKKV